MIQHRDYQVFGLNAWLDWISAGDKGNPLLLYPTGVGKSVILAMIISHLIKTYGSPKILVLTHSKELIQQDYDKLKEHWPACPAGIYCAGLKKENYWSQVVVGSIQTVHNIPELFGKVDFVFIDEAHLISLKDDSMYRKFLTTLGQRNEHLVVTGLTATGWRAGQGWLWNGENALFSGAAVNACDLDAYNWFFDEGYLAPLHARKTKFQYDATDIKIKGGEYDEHQIQETFDNKTMNEKVVLTMLPELQRRQSGLIFVNGVKQVENIASILEAYGVDVTFVHSKMKDTERDDRIKAYKRGEYHTMVNNGILTTGFDHPMLDYIGMAKLTMRSSLWGQMLGRGTRPFYAEGFDLSTREGRLMAIAASHKPYCLVDDFAKNTERLGPINDPVVPIPGKRRQKGVAPIRICDECGSYNHASAPVCMVCGFEFPRSEKLNDGTSGKDLIKKAKKTTQPLAIERHDFAVDTVTYQIHNKKDRPASLKVTYHCGIRSFPEWIHFDGVGVIRARAINWWTQRAGGSPSDVPATAMAAAERSTELRTPTYITVNMSSQFAQVIDYEY